MNRNQIVGLAVVLAAMIFMGVWTKRPPELESLERQAGLASLLPAAVTAENVTAIELAVGKEKTAVRLVRAGEAWRIETSWNAPADGEKVAAFLKSLVALKGELRSEKADAHADYGVDDEQGMRARLFTAASGDKPAAELIAGKKPAGGYGSAFVRTAGDARVWLVDKDLRGDVGIWEEGAKAAPAGKHWVRSALTKVDKDAIAKLEFLYPEKTLAFEKIEREVPVEAKPEEAKKDGEAAAKPEEKKPETRKEVEWKLAAGGPGGEFKKAEIEALLEAAAKFEVEDAIDPAQKQALGLDKPGYRCVVTLKDGKKVELLASRQRAKESVAVCLADAPEALFSMGAWQFDRLFRKGGDLFPLETPVLDKEKVRTLKLVRGAESVALSRDEKNAWKLAGAGNGFPLRQEPATALLDALAGWKAQDYADATGAAGLEPAVCALEIGFAEGPAQTLLLGAEHPGIRFSHVAAAAKGPVRLMAEADVQKIFPVLDALLDLASVTDLQEGEITAVAAPGCAVKKTMAKDKDGKETEAFVVEADGKSSPADPGKAREFFQAVATLRAKALLPAKEIEGAFPADGTAMLKVETAKGTLTVELGKARENGDRPARASTRGVPFLLEKAGVESLLPAAGAFAPTPAKTEAKTTVANPFEGKPEAAPAEAKPADAKPEEKKPEDAKAGPDKGEAKP